MTERNQENRKQSFLRFPLEVLSVPANASFTSPRNNLARAYFRKEVEESIELHVQFLRYLGAEVSAYSRGNRDPENSVSVIFPLDIHKGDGLGRGPTHSKNSIEGLHLSLSNIGAFAEYKGSGAFPQYQESSKTCGGKPIRSFNCPAVWRVIQNLFEDLQKLPVKP